MLDRRMRKVARGDREISMAASEYRLLEVFLEKPRQVLSRSYLLDHVWGQDAGVDERTVDVYVGRLRKSLIRKNGFDPIRGSFLTPLHCRLSSNLHHVIDDFVNDGSSLDLDFVIHAEDAPGISLRGKPFRFVRQQCIFYLEGCRAQGPPRGGQRRSLRAAPERVVRRISLIGAYGKECGKNAEKRHFWKNTTRRPTHVHFYRSE